VESQVRDEAAGRAELDRGYEEVSPGRTNKLVKLGSNAIFNAEAVDAP
jgi:hypothetical protein